MGCPVLILCLTWNRMKILLIFICTLEFFYNNKNCSKTIPKPPHKYISNVSWCVTNKPFTIGNMYNVQNLMLASQISRMFENNLFWSTSFNMCSTWIASRHAKNNWKYLLNNYYIIGSIVDILILSIFQHLHQLPFARHVYNPPQW